MENWNILLEELECKIDNNNNDNEFEPIAINLINVKIINLNTIYCEIGSKDLNNFEQYFLNSNGWVIKIKPNNTYRVNLCFKSSNKYYLILNQ